MLHLLSQLPKDNDTWSRLGMMMSMGDSVLIYQEASDAILSNHTSEKTLTLLNDLARIGVKIYICPDNDSVKKTIVPKNINSNTVIPIDWQGVVKLVESETGVNSL